MRYIIDKRTRHGQSRPSRAARGAPMWRFSPRRFANQLARLRSVARLRLFLIVVTFNLKMGKSTWNSLVIGRRLSVCLVAASSERFSKRAGPSWGTIGRWSRTPLLVWRGQGRSVKHSDAGGRRHRRLSNRGRNGTVQEGRLTIRRGHLIWPWRVLRAARRRRA